MKALFTIIIFMVGSHAFAQNFTLSSEKQAKIREYIDHFEKNGQLMGNVSIFTNGKEVLNETFGATNTEETAYSVGSITKLITAVLITKRADDKKLNLNDPLCKYFSEMPGSKTIKLHQMIDHTSGLGDYVVKNDTLEYWLKEPVSREEILSEIIRQGVLFEPGDSLSYSNSAYYLLARILEKSMHKTYARIIESQLAKPLGLKHTYATSNKKPYGAVSYEKQQDKWVPMKDFHFQNASGVGDIMTNAHDLNVFMNALFTGQILKPETVKAMLPENTEWFGDGIMQVPFYEHVAYGHGGDTYGTHSVTSYNPKNQLGITYIINGENYPTNDFAIGLFSILYDKPYELPEFNEYTGEPQNLETYAGTYSSPEFPMNLKIFVEGEKLKGQGDGQPAFILSPIEKDVFEFIPAGLKISFDDNKLLLEQGGQSFEMMKE